MNDQTLELAIARRMNEQTSEFTLTRDLVAPAARQVRRGRLVRRIVGTGVTLTLAVALAWNFSLTSPGPRIIPAPPADGHSTSTPTSTFASTLPNQGSTGPDTGPASSPASGVGRNLADLRRALSASGNLMEQGVVLGGGQSAYGDDSVKFWLDLVDGSLRQRTTIRCDGTSLCEDTDYANIHNSTIVIDVDYMAHTWMKSVLPGPTGADGAVTMPGTRTMSSPNPTDVGVGHSLMFGLPVTPVQLLRELTTDDGWTLVAPDATGITDASGPQGLTHLRRETKSRQVDKVDILEIWVDDKTHLPRKIQVEDWSDAAIRATLNRTVGPQPTIEPNLVQANLTWVPRTSANLAELTPPIPAGFRRE